MKCVSMLINNRVKFNYYVNYPILLNYVVFSINNGEHIYNSKLQYTTRNTYLKTINHTYIEICVKQETFQKQ